MWQSQQKNSAVHLVTKTSLLDHTIFPFSFFIGTLVLFSLSPPPLDPADAEIYVPSDERPELSKVPQLKPWNSSNVWWNGNVCNRLPTLVHIVTHTAAVIPATLIAARQLRGFQGWSCCCCCWSLLYSATLRSRADSLRSYRTRFWVTVDSCSAFWISTEVVYLQRCLVVAWLVSSETAAVSVRSVYTISCITSRHFVQSHLHRKHVTCHLHFWLNDQDLFRATAVTQGWNGYPNKSAQKLDPGEENSRTHDLLITRPAL